MPVSTTTFLVIFAVCVITVELAYRRKMQASDGRIKWWDSLRWVVGRNSDAPKLVQSRAIYLALVSAILIWFVNATTYHTFVEGTISTVSGDCYRAGDEYLVWVSEVPQPYVFAEFVAALPCDVF